ncbi:MAG: hypothetical protein POELPBGB_01097 [Bacteroidia bacterium]|nr:hypothetical protein [Bacteroidia bacterium]
MNPKNRIGYYLTGEVELRRKCLLIEKFIKENLPNIPDSDCIPDEFYEYWQEQQVLALGNSMKDNKLDKEQLKALIETYIFSGQEPLRDDVLKCLGDRPSILKARGIGERIINK